MDDDFGKTRKMIGFTISTYRRRLGITQKELGDRIDTDAQYISRIERGLTTISLKRLFEIAQHLECQAKDLLDFDILERRN